MAAPRPSNAQATYWIVATGAAGSCTAAIPDPPASSPLQLVVLDHITANCETDAAGVRNLIFLGVTAQRSDSVASGAVSWDIDFGGGLPLWNAASSDTTPNTGNQVQVTGGGAADACTAIVTYHYENPAMRRA